MTPINLTDHPIVSRELWLQSRTALLKREKEQTALRDQLNADRRALPWVKVDKDYRFTGPGGEIGLADLFAGKSQLILYHFMFAPGWEEGCTGCSFLSDHVDSARQHFEHSDVAFAAVSRAPFSEFEPFKKRMGWKFNWVSSAESDFNYDYHVSFTDEQVTEGEADYNFTKQEENPGECPGISIFYKNEAGEIFHTYSAYARGLEELLTTFQFMDLTPKGRNEETTMNWVRKHDQYEAAPSPCGCCHEGE